MSELRIGLIGFGKWVRSAYLPALHRDGRAVVTAVAASSEKTRQKARELLGEDTAVYESYEELLKDAKVDAVMIALPDRLHQPALAAALRTGIAVFYEPPIAHLRSQIAEMVNGVLSAKQVTFAHLELEYHPAVSRAAELIRSGAIGAPENVTITLHAGWGADQNADLCLLDRMSAWYVDVLNRIIGSVPERVLLLDGHGAPGRMQTVSTGIYDYNGVWGIFKADVGRSGGVSITIDIDGTQGNISINYFTGVLAYQNAANPDTVFENCTPLAPYADYPGVHEAVSAFLDAVSKNDISLGNAGKVAQLNFIGLAIEKSKDTGSWAAVTKL